MKLSNRNLMIVLIGVGLGFLGLAYAAVPLYRAFCQATGFGGSTRRIEAAQLSSASQSAKLRVHFDTNINGVDLDFRAEKPYLDTQIGHSQMVYFHVTNRVDHPVTVRATYNVGPEAMGPYFLKLQCFCFTNQTLKAHESKTFPVIYYLDSKMFSDVDARSISDVTLSYTFFPVTNAKP